MYIIPTHPLLVLRVAAAGLERCATAVLLRAHAHRHGARYVNREPPLSVKKPTHTSSYTLGNGGVAKRNCFVEGRTKRGKGCWRRAGCMWMRGAWRKKRDDTTDEGRETVAQSRARAYTQRAATAFAKGKLTRQSKRTVWGRTITQRAAGRGRGVGARTGATGGQQQQQQRCRPTTTPACLSASSAASSFHRAPPQPPAATALLVCSCFFPSLRSTCGARSRGRSRRTRSWRSTSAGTSRATRGSSRRSRRCTCAPAARRP